MQVPLLDLYAQYANILGEIRQGLEELFSTHRYILGPQVEELEEKIAAYSRARYGIGCASGTDALLLALQALQIKEDDEVITTAFTFFATASCIHRVGAKPVFVDINPRTFNIDPDKIEPAITERTRAIIAVHLFGQPAEMDRILHLAQKYDLKVIEDNAQSIGSKYQGKTVGALGDIGTLSFFPSKNLGAMGDAGMCITNDKDLADSIRLLRHHGENPKYFHKRVGLNSRLDTIQATILLVKLPYLEKWNADRIKNARYYYKELADLEQIILPEIHPQAFSIFNQFTIRVKERDKLFEYLQKRGVGCAIYYPQPLHIQECFSYLGYKKGDLPLSEEASLQVLSIPIYSELTDIQKDYVVRTIRNFYR
ncbi:MAG: DegT/DnrJ/EryC1/StrS family aminotransferase [Candidatus Cloacimonetes bacterium]|nr:DegT/DnrJ/EryC1/StrS family aminotransferase [Candidatus Cloacimonadota bacterium]